MNPQLFKGIVTNVIAGAAGGLLVFVLTKPVPTPIGEASPDSEGQMTFFQNEASVPTDLKACVEDIKKFCADVPRGNGRWKRCLLSRKSELASGCLEAAEKFSAP